MHMSDALITPIVGGAMIATSAGIINYSAKKMETELVEKKVPYMGLVSAFVFAAQMINFAIPGTGSSGHIGGGMLLAILLGPHAGFLAMATILLIQALFFADGGLLAFGCNLINLGFFTCYLVYPLVYKPLSHGSKKKMLIGTVLATIIGLQLGAFGVVVETVFSGRTDLPFSTFLTFMQPIHLAIGIVEGFITAAVVSFLYDRRDDLIFDFFNEVKSTSFVRKNKRVLRGFVVMVILIGGLFSQFASGAPDGLEWSIENVIARAEGTESSTEITSTIATTLGGIQDKTAVLPDYDFKVDASEIPIEGVGTSVSGIVGSGLVVLVMAAIALFIRTFQKRSSKGTP